MFRTVTVHPQELLCRYCMCRLWYVLIRPAGRTLCISLECTYIVKKKLYTTACRYMHTYETYINKYIYTYVRTYIYTYIHTYTYLRTRIYTYIYGICSSWLRTRQVVKGFILWPRHLVVYTCYIGVTFRNIIVNILEHNANLCLS